MVMLFINIKKVELISAIDFPIKDNMGYFGSYWVKPISFYDHKCVTNFTKTELPKIILDYIGQTLLMVLINVNKL